MFPSISPNTWKTPYHILVSVLHCFIKSFYMQFIAHLDENDKSKLVMFLKLIWLIIIVIVFLVKPLDFFARIFLIASDVKISWIQNVLSFEVWKDVYMHNKLCLMHCYRLGLYINNLKQKCDISKYIYASERKRLPEQ